MAYLITLITPPQETSIVLDPFMGSGSTGISALLLNKRFIGIEKEEEYINDVFQVLDSTTQPLTGIEQLHEIKEETTKRWKESGLLDGLTDGIPDNLAKMLESKDSFIINKENEIFTRIHVIDILNEFAFFLSDNGDPDTTGKEWLDMQYPEK